MSAEGSSKLPGSESVPRAAVGRLSLYLRQLERLSREGVERVSSRRLGASLGISDAQVRKDLGYFGQFGHAGIGYEVAELFGSIRHILGTDHEWPVALVGIGNLGRALVGYRGFRHQGFRIVAIFDADPHKIGKNVAGIRVDPIAKLSQRVAELQIALGIIAVPGDSAQAVADSLAASGVRGILNFAPIPLTLPSAVRLVSVDLAIQLEWLSYLVDSRRQTQESSG